MPPLVSYVRLEVLPCTLTRPPIHDRRRPPPSAFCPLALAVLALSPLRSTSPPRVPEAPSFAPHCLFTPRSHVPPPTTTTTTNPNTGAPRRQPSLHSLGGMRTSHPARVPTCHLVYHPIPYGDMSRCSLLPPTAPFFSPTPPRGSLVALWAQRRRGGSRFGICVCVCVVGVSSRDFECWEILFVSIITITITGTTTVLIFSPLFVLPFFGLLGFALGMPREVLFFWFLV